VLASLNLGDLRLAPRAVLDLAPAPDGLLALLWATDRDHSDVGLRVDYRVLRLPFAGDVEVSRRDLFTYWGANAGSVRAVGASVRAVLLTTETETITAPQRVSVQVATWSNLDEAPAVETYPLRDEPIAGCRTCERYGAAVVQDDAYGVAAVASDGEMHIARVAFSDESVERWSVPMPGSGQDAPVGGASDGRGRALLVAGGTLAEFGGSHEGAAFGVPVVGEAGPSIAIPGGRFDPPPLPVVFEDRSELVRFRFGDDGVTGMLHRFRLDAGGLRDLGTIETGLGLAPYGMTSTSRTVIWAEPDPSLPGTANLQVLVHDAACGSELPTLAANLPHPLIDLDPRVIAATERGGHTFVLVIEQRGFDDQRATILDLGACEALPDP
jgi:hypothetical protein